MKRGVRSAQTKKSLNPHAFRQQIVEIVRAARKPSELAKKFGCDETNIAARLPYPVYLP
jgi:hypothetical protein